MAIRNWLENFSPPPSRQSGYSNPMSEDEIKVAQCSTPYRGYVRIDVYKLTHKVFDQGWSAEISREVLERGHAVAVLPYDADRDKVVLLEQFRIGGYTAHDFSPWQIECVAGVVETGHLPEDTAHREVHEEAGLEIHELEAIHHYLSSPGCTSESIRLYCGQVDAEGAGGLHGIAHEGEYIRVFTVTAAEAFAMLDRGEIANGMTIIALQWLKLHHKNLREKWRLAWSVESADNNS